MHIANLQENDAVGICPGNNISPGKDLECHCDKFIFFLFFFHGMVRIGVRVKVGAEVGTRFHKGLPAQATTSTSFNNLKWRRESKAD